MEVELHLGMAWLMSQSNSNTKVAMESVQNAVTRTGYRDWSALAAAVPS